MGKLLVRLLLIALIAAALYKLNEELELVPVTKGREPPAIEVARELEAVASDKPASQRMESLESELADHFLTRTDRFTVAVSGDREQLSQKLPELLQSAIREDDYTAYILGSYNYTLSSRGNRSTIEVEVAYRETKEQTAAVDRKVAEVLARIVTPEMNSHEVVKAVHDWIVTNVEYDETLSLFTAYNAISEGRAVCQGYALLGYKMLSEAGLPVLIAEGAVETGEHAWNMVQLDGIWYHLDLTWDDPVGASGSDISYSYYLRTDAELKKDHSWTRDYPAATRSYADVLSELQRSGTESESLRWSSLKLALGLHLLDPEHTLADAGQLNEAIGSAVRSNVKHLQFRYLDEAGFPAALEAAFREIDRRVGYRASYESFAGEPWLKVDVFLEYE